MNVLAPKVRLDPPPERDARADTDLVRVQVEVPAVSEAFLELVADADLPLPVGEVPDLGEPDRVGVAVARRKLPVESLLFEIVPCMAVKEVCRSVLRETDLAARGEDVRPAEEVSVQDRRVELVLDGARPGEVPDGRRSQERSSRAVRGQAELLEGIVRVLGLVGRGFQRAEPARRAQKAVLGGQVLERAKARPVAVVERQRARGGRDVGILLDAEREVEPKGGGLPRPLELNPLLAEGLHVALR